MPISTHAVKAIIKNENDEILFLQGNKHIHKKLLWDLPGGLIEDKENEQEALLRELREELNLKAQIISKAGNWKFFRPLDNQWIKVQNYICQIPNENIILSNEHGTYKWLSLKKLITNPSPYPIKNASLIDTLLKN